VLSSNSGGWDTPGFFFRGSCVTLLERHRFPRSLQRSNLGLKYSQSLMSISLRPQHREHGAQEPFFIGKAAASDTALYDTNAGEARITYTWELGDQETPFGKMCNNDVALRLDIIKYEPVQVGSNLYERTAKRFPVYVEGICVCNVRLEAVGNKVKLVQGESTRILLAVPRDLDVVL
jgi:hypothetical protein